jgi:hypothetical protein
MKHIQWIIYTIYWTSISFTRMMQNESSTSCQDTLHKSALFPHKELAAGWLREKLIAGF